MKKLIMEFSILYKNGIEEVIKQPIGTEADAEDLLDVMDTIQTSMREEADGIITLGDGELTGNYIR